MNRQDALRSASGDFTEETIGRSEGRILCRERLGGLLKFYHRQAG